MVNNAGITRDKMFHTLDDATFDFVIDVNLTTAFHTHAGRDAVPARGRQGRDRASTARSTYHRKITFTSSVAALMGNPGQYNYTAAKGAIIAITKTLARELGPFGSTSTPWRRASSRPG